MGSRNDLLGNGLGVGHHNYRLCSAQSVQNLSAKTYVGVVNLVPIGIGPAVGVREEQYRPIGQEFLEVVEKVGGLLFVAAQHDHWAL